MPRRNRKAHSPEQGKLSNPTRKPYSISKLNASSKTKNALTTLSEVKGGSDASKKRALKGFHIPKVKKSDAINSNFVLNTTNEIKTNHIKSNNVETSKSNSDQVLLKDKTPKKSSLLVLSETNSVPEIEKSLKEPLVEEILSDIDELDYEKGDEKDDTFYEDFKRKKPLCRIYDSTKKKSEISKNLSRKKCKPDVSNHSKPKFQNGEIKQSVPSSYTKKKDRPLRKVTIIRRELSDLSSDGDIENELDERLKNHLSKNSVNQTKKDKCDKVISTPIYYIRGDYNDKKNLFNGAPFDPDEATQAKRASYKTDDNRSDAKDEDSVLDTTPAAPPTPHLLSSDSENNNPVGFEDNELNLSFSPNTTVSEKENLNHSTVHYDTATSDSPNIGKPHIFQFNDAEELDPSFVDQLRNEDENILCDDEVPMDWAAADNTGLMGELQQCRLDLQLNPTCSPSIDFPQNVFDNSKSEEEKRKGLILYVVIDTNIFIAQLGMVEKLLNLNSNGNERNVVNRAKLYIPWAVLDELDHLKLAGKRPTNPNMKLEFNARKAISFLHQKLSSNNNQICGQNQLEEQEAEIYKAHNADDRILRTCLKLKAEGKQVVLYTNDRNLANKSIISGIKAYDSTKILRGIADAKLQSKSVLDDACTDSKRSSSRSTDRRPENILNDTLIPDSEDEEDMAIDIEKANDEESCSNQTVATENDLHQLFNDVWETIYNYACRYSIALRLPLGKNLPTPNESELPPDLNPKMNGKHLNQLASGVVELAKFLNDFMKIQPSNLAVNTRELVSFHGCMTAFLVKLDRFRPADHSPSPTHPPIRPSVMMTFALQPKNRELLASGLNQLVELRTILFECKKKVTALLA